MWPKHFKCVLRVCILCNKLYNLIIKHVKHVRCFRCIFIAKTPIPKVREALGRVANLHSIPRQAPETKVGYFLALPQVPETETCRNVTKPDSPQVLHVFPRAVWHHVLRLRQSKTSEAHELRAFCYSFYHLTLLRC